MDSKQTDNSKKQIPDDWMSASVSGKTKPSKQVDEGVEAKLREIFPDSNAIGENENSIATIQAKERTDSVDSLQTESADVIRSTVSKRTSGKQRKESLEEYRQTFLSVPKLEDRKPVFISREVRDRLDEIVRKLGGRGRSVSGFIENLARHHLETYQDDVELWKKL